MNIKQRLALFVTAAVIAVSALVPATAAREEPGTGASWVLGTPSFSYEQSLANLIAAEHDAYCAPYTIEDVQLQSYARYKAADEGWQNYYAHANLNGRYYYDLYPNGGIAYVGTQASEILTYDNVADNIAPGYAFNSYMNSTAHRNAIRSCTYDRFGVGSFKQGDGTHYWVVEFKNHP